MSKLPERFKVDRELGRGGMGVVYKAFDTAFGRDVAVKVLPDQVQEDELLFRFRREGMDLAGMSHPNVVACFDYGNHEGHDFIVMEYVDGGNLRQYVKNSSGLADIVRVYCEICEGLDHIHSRGIVHRDVKPGNILFTSGGVPKIADFGISRRMDSETQITQVGTIMGTSSFVAPEMIVSSSSVTPSADLYALGVCLFESLTGRLPLTGDTEFAVLNAHLNEAPPKPSEVRADIPPLLDDIVLKLLAKRAEERPSGAKETAELLRECLREALSAPPPVIGTEDDEPTKPTSTGQALEGLLNIDAQGRIQACNPEAALLLGRPTSELFGKPIELFLPKMRNLTKRGSGLHGQTMRLEGRKQVEQMVPLEVSFSAIESAHGTQLSATVRACEPDAQSVASSMLQSANFDYLSRMSHEIWTPMNGILGMTRLTLNTDLDTDQRRFLKALETSAERLQEVMQTLFDFVRLGDGSLELQPVPIVLRHFLESVLKPYSFEAGSKNLYFTSQVEPLVPDSVVVDPNRLRQILHHLIQNALKFTERGGIDLRVSRLSEDDNKITLKFSISDTGEGIAPGREKQVFRPFYQEDASISRKAGGVGLGLSIVQGLVQKMGGQVNVESRRGRGSVFHVVLELGVSDPVESTSYRARLGGLKVLLLNPDAQPPSFLQLLQRWGLDVQVARTEQEAGELIESGREFERPFDIVIAEANHPTFDAYEFVKNYKLNHEAFLLYSDSITEGDAAECRRLAVDALLDKPVNATELWSAVLKILKDGPRSRASDFGSLHILLAEDNPINQTLATVLLNSHGHQVTVAENGLEVLVKLEQDNFDLILMDLQMPQMDGITTSKKIRADEKAKGQHIPIVALTAQVHPGSLEECMAAGMDAYLNKPIEEDQLMSVIARLIDKKEAGDVLLREPAPVKEETITTPGDRDTETTNYNVVDEFQLLARVGNNSKHLIALLDIFLSLYAEQLAEIKAAIDSGEAEKLYHASHKFKGSVKNFNAHSAADAAEALERIGRAGSTAGADSEYISLVKETEILVVALRAMKERHIKAASSLRKA